MRATRLLPFVPPLAVAELYDFLARRAVPGVEACHDGTYRRVLDLPRRLGWMAVDLGNPGPTTLRVEVDADAADHELAFSLVRQLCGLDTDPRPIDAALAADSALAPLIDARPGLRSPGHVDGAELAVRALLGQQITVTAARTIAGRLVAAVDAGFEVGLNVSSPGLTHRFPRPTELLALPGRLIPGPEARNVALRTLCHALVAGDVDLTIRRATTADVVATCRALVALRGIGPWTAGYISMRVLADPDVYLPTDTGVRHGVRHVGLDPDDRSLIDRWRPWRSFVVHHLWASS